ARRLVARSMICQRSPTRWGITSDPTYPITIEVICLTYGRNRGGGTRQYRKSTLCVGQYCGIELTESIQANILRCLPLGTGRLGLRRSKPALRMRKPTLDYVAGPRRFRCIY